MVRRKNQTIMLDATEETTVSQLKKTLEAILKQPPDEQQLYKIETNEPLDDARTLGDCGFKSSNSKAQDPSTIGLRFKIGNHMCAKRYFIYYTRRGVFCKIVNQFLPISKSWLI